RRSCPAPISRTACPPLPRSDDWCCSRSRRGSAWRGLVPSPPRPPATTRRGVCPPSGCSGRVRAAAPSGAPAGRAAGGGGGVGEVVVAATVEAVVACQHALTDGTRVIVVP